LQANTSSKILPGIRFAAALVLSIAGTALFILGAQPMAVGLFQSPWDKLAHIGIFALIGCAAGVASGSQGWIRIGYCVAGTLALGITDELHQSYLPGRSASWADLVADGVGGMAGAALLQFTRAFGLQHLKNR
jgi:VanZ family protein